MTQTRNTQQRGIWQRLSEMVTTVTPEPIQEIIGRIRSRFIVRYPARITVDYTQTDYEYWDKFRRGKQRGFEIGGVFARPISQILAGWTLGDGFTVDIEHQETSEAISEFLQNELQTLIELTEDSLALGDSYIVINPDGSLTQVPASQVEIEVAETDVRTITKVTIRIQDNESGITIEDVYTTTQRTITTKKASRIGFTRRERVANIETYPNLIGRIPVVHFPNDRGANEVYGHPYYEELLTLFAEYDDVIRKGLDGVKLMGNPIPVFENLNDAKSAQAQDKQYSDSYIDTEGTTRDNDVVELSPHEVIYTEGQFNFKSPGNFTPNTKDMLKKLFQLMLQNTQIPEWAWGGAIASSMASVQAQLPAFAKFIQGRRRKTEKNILAVLEIYLATVSLFTPNIMTNEKMAIEWPELIPQNEEIKLKWVQFMDAQGYLQKSTVVRLSELVKNADDEIEQADKEAMEAEKRFQDSVDTSIETMMQERENRLSDDTNTTDSVVVQSGQQNGRVRSAA